MPDLFSFICLVSFLLGYQYLVLLAFAFTCITIGILLCILVFLNRFHKKKLLKKNLRLLFSDLIAGMAICDDEEECSSTLRLFLEQQPMLLQNPFARKVLIRELVIANDSFSGHSANNLRWLYEELVLYKDTLRHFTSGKWYRKTEAIQHLAEMQQTRYLTRIYRETNNENRFVRTEAQIAVVKLTGFKGLRFLNIITHRVSQWQQLSLISHLPPGQIQEEMIDRWLCSENDTVVEFALRLVTIFNCYPLHNRVIQNLGHPSPVVRILALNAIREINGEESTQALIAHFSKAPKEEQILILSILADAGGKEELTFLQTLRHHNNEAIRHRVAQAVLKIESAIQVNEPATDNERSIYAGTLSMMQKKAV